MPKDRSVLQYQLQIAETQLAQIESRLLESVDADEASALVEHAVDLTTVVLELKNELGDVALENNSQRAR